METIRQLDLITSTDGTVRCIYDEALDLRELGKLQITRASHVEPDAEGYWWADMGPVDGPVLGPYGSRSEALEAERGWLAMHDKHSRENMGFTRRSSATDAVSPNCSPKGVG